MGGVATSELDELVKQSIAIILGTAPGERVMRMQFGCEIHELLFAPNNLHTATLASQYCLEALSKWEPRIHEIEVDSGPGHDEPNRLDITIRYKLRGSHKPPQYGLSLLSQ